MVRHRAGQAGIAQSVEHFTRNEGVVSSSLISGSKPKAQPAISWGLRFYFSFSYIGRMRPHTSSRIFYPSSFKCTVSWL